MRRGQKKLEPKVRGRSRKASLPTHTPPPKRKSVPKGLGVLRATSGLQEPLPPTRKSAGLLPTKRKSGASQNCTVCAEHNLVPRSHFMTKSDCGRSGYEIILNILSYVGPASVQGIYGKSRHTLRWGDQCNKTTDG